MPAHRVDNRTPPGVFPTNRSSPLTGSSNNSTPRQLRRPRRDNSLASSDRSGESSNLSMQGPWSRSPDVDIVLVEPLDKAYECPVCCNLLWHPVQFEDCGHHCCSSCLPELMRVAPRCPIDQSRIDRDRVVVDKVMKSLVESVMVKCSYWERGCSWSAPYSQLLPHMEECDHTLTPCPKQCGAEFERRFLDGHSRTDCPRRDMRCQHCDALITKETHNAHLETCDNLPVPCPNGCKAKNIHRREVQKHIDTECKRTVMVCPFSITGCHYKGERIDVLRHIREEADSHLEMAGRAMLTFKDKLDLHSRAMEKHIARVTLVENKVDALEKLYGSQLVWKIDGYSEKLQECKSGQKTTIYSPPFLTSRHGYKMAMSACLYGDGKAKGTHMSLFICICRGDFDALLSWPFSHRLTFTLFDQCQDTSARRNITYTIKPNTCADNLPFLGRPTGERNASFGAQCFVKLDVISTLDYVRDDCLYVKVVVDTENMVLL